MSCKSQVQVKYFMVKIFTVECNLRIKFKNLNFRKYKSVCTIFLVFMWVIYFLILCKYFKNTLYTKYTYLNSHIMIKVLRNIMQR